MAATTTKQTVPVRLTNFKAGVDKNLTGKATLQINGTAYTGAALDTEIEGYLDPYTVEATAVANLKAARQAVKAKEAEAVAFLDAAGASVKGFYGPTNPIIEDFGLSVPKARTPLSPEAALARKVKLNETRELRGTMSAKKKAGIKSTSTVTVTATSSSAPAASSPVAPAGSTASAPASNSAAAPVASNPPAAPAAAGSTAAGPSAAALTAGNV